MNSLNEIGEGVEVNSILSQQLIRNNGGVNFFNLNSKKIPYYLEIELKTDITITERKEYFNISTNLPSTSGGYFEEDLSKILKDFAEWCLIPRLTLKEFNRRKENKIISDYWDLRRMRTSEIQLADIKIEIGEKAEKKLMQIYKKPIAEILNECISKQKDITEQEQKDLDKWCLLKTENERLKKYFKSNNDYGYRRYDEVKDNTKQIVIEVEDYNSKIKRIEGEIKELEKKYLFLKSLSPKFEYQKTAETFETWKENHLDALKEDYKDYKIEQKENGEEVLKFEEYCLHQYEYNDEEGEE